MQFNVYDKNVQSYDFILQTYSNKILFVFILPSTKYSYGSESVNNFKV